MLYKSQAETVKIVEREDAGPWRSEIYRGDELIAVKDMGEINLKKGDSIEVTHKFDVA
jgi:hypothetical protein